MEFCINIKIGKLNTINKKDAIPKRLIIEYLSISTKSLKVISIYLLVSLL